MNRANAGDRYPIFRALGAKHEFMDAEQSAAASRDERIKSIWPFIVRKSKGFYRSLKPRERVNFDPEDVLVELWTAVAERDHKWSPERGKYITFAGTIIAKKLCEIRDAARTVESPRNSSCRMKEYLGEEAAGTITPQRRKSADDIRRTSEGAQTIDGGKGDGHLPTRTNGDPVCVLVGREIGAEVRDAVATAIRSLSTYEATVVGRLCGLWDQPRQTAFWIAWETGRELSDVRRAKASAIQKIRESLLSVGHPVTKNDD